MKEKFIKEKLKKSDKQNRRVLFYIFNFEEINKSEKSMKIK